LLADYASSVKFNKIGIMQKKNLIPFRFRKNFEKLADSEDIEETRSMVSSFHMRSRPSTPASPPIPSIALTESRRTVLIATMEYDIEDWNIKIKIGGLGVMAQ
jgi:alpha-1,3-glucan synthase